MTPVAVESIAVDDAIAGLSVEELVARFGSPLYLYDANVLRARANALRAAMPDGVSVAFATKSNPSPLVLSTLRKSGLGTDVASGGELRAVLRAGFDAADVVFTGPGKTDAELLAALAAGVGGLTLESLDELEALMDMAGQARSGQGLLLRLATNGDAETTPIIGAAGSDKFGLTDEEADDAVARLRAASLLAPSGPFVLRGFHAFGASNVLEARVLVRGVADLAVRAERIATRHRLRVEMLDAGGGLGIPYGDEQPLDLQALGEGLRGELATWSARGPLRQARLLLEPGRWLSGPAGVYVCRVTRTKSRDGRHIAITDGGIHHLLRPRLVGRDHRVVPTGAAARRASDARVDVVGPLCTGIDVLATGVSAPSPQAGDLYAVRDAGAYGYSESMPLFLSHPTPAEVVLDAGTPLVSRARIEPE